MNTIFTQIAVRIIREQELVIGPLAWDEARKVSGLVVVDARAANLSFEGSAREVLDKLVARYERLFGRISREVCRGAAQSLLADLPQSEIPESLK